jgi:hypothetical protein
VYATATFSSAVLTHLLLHEATQTRLLPLLLRSGGPASYVSDRFLYVLSLELLLLGAFPRVTLMSLRLSTSDEALYELHRLHLRRDTFDANPGTRRSLQQKPRA